MDDKWKSKALFIRLVVLESGLGLESGKSPFLLDLDLDLKALDLDSDLEVLPASPFFKYFVLYLYLKNVPISESDKLIPAVQHIVAIPASSAPVERVFSHGGIVLRPHRARMSDKLLSELVFLKCNIV